MAIAATKSKPKRRRSMRYSGANRCWSATVRKMVDAVIATCCIENDFTLFYSDRDFDLFVEHLGVRRVASL